jgi:hypothetical protein
MPCFIHIWIILKIRETPSTFWLAHVSSRNTYWQIAEAPYVTCEEKSVTTITQLTFAITGIPLSMYVNYAYMYCSGSPFLNYNILLNMYTFCLPLSYMSKANRTTGVSYWTKLEKSSYWVSSKQYRSEQEQPVPEDGECTVNLYDCGKGTVWEPRKGSIRRWKPVPEDWYGTADQKDQVRVMCEK